MRFRRRQHERARIAAARLINADANDIALIRRSATASRRWRGADHSARHAPSSCWKTITPRRCWNGTPRRGTGLRRRDRAPAADGDWTSAYQRQSTAQVRRRSARLDLLGALVGRRIIGVDKVQTALAAAGRHVRGSTRPERGRGGDGCHPARPRRRDLSDLQWLVAPTAAPSSTWQTPPERRTAGADLRPGRRNVNSENPVYFGDSPMSTTRGVTTWANATIHHAGNGSMRHGDDGGMGRR